MAQYQSLSSSAVTTALIQHLDAGHDIKAYIGDSSIIAADPNVDFVAISVKAPLHRQVVLPVIAAKKPFFIEWPVKKLLAAGAIGAVRSSTFIGLVPRELGYFQPQVNAANRYVLDPESGVSSLSIPAGHQLDSFTYLLGDFATVHGTSAILYPVTTVYADRKPTDETVQSLHPDHYTISGVLKSGALATLVWRTGYPTTKGRRNLLWEIDGEEGSIRLEVDAVFLNISTPAVYLNGEKVEVEGAEAGTLGIIGAAWTAYAKGEKEKYADLEDALKTRHLLDAVERSFREGKTIVLE